mmetsp:Transcript_70145/g.227018  ORF Transcript_70145/g.227018 Transcript_70145/m.227018 type:complete len:625 (-) Transcript_70145:87-1961(-)
MAEKAKKTCYYELLGVDRKCETAEIKTSYRKLALKMHPDKAHLNNLSVEEATQSFQQVQEAYSVLSDPQERAWYDAHREQILRGDDEPGEDPFKTKINLYKYFSTSCFQGFGNGPSGFYAVYTELFEMIDTEEAEWEDADEDHTPMPPFGRADMEWADVSAFYRHWLDFCSRKAFGHADRWNPKDAQNRQVRRAMEQENKKARQAAKRDFNAEVRQLVRFVQKRDPRVAAHQKEQMKATAEKKQRDLANKEHRKAKEAQERQERQDAARRADEERWAEVQAEREARRQRGEIVSEDDESEADTEEVEYMCEPCRKSFKSEKAFDQHTKSKKHLQIVAKLRRELEVELELEAEAEAKVEEEEEELRAEEAVEEGAEEAAEEAVENAAAEGLQGNSGGGGGGGKESEEESEDDDEEDEDYFLARFAAARKPAKGDVGDGEAGGRQARAAVGGDAAGGGEAGNSAEAGGGEGGEASSGDAESDNAAAEGGGGKKAQKRAKQRAILLGKKEERESVQDLVSGCRKAQRAARRGTPEAAGASAEEAGEGQQVGENEEQAAAEPATAPLAGGNAAPASAPLGESSRCAVCGESFASRTKLFNHIKASGHAALKPVPTSEGTGAKGRKKKR